MEVTSPEYSVYIKEDASYSAENNEQKSSDREDNQPTIVWTNEATTFLLHEMKLAYNDFTGKSKIKVAILSRITLMLQPLLKVTYLQVKNKWKNLHTRYMRYRENLFKTEPKKMKKPIFYDEVHEIVKYTPKVNEMKRQNVCDEYEEFEYRPKVKEMKRSSSSDEDDELDEFESQPVRKRVKRKKPNTLGQEMMLAMRELNATISIGQEEQNKLLKRHNEIEEEKLKILKKICAQLNS